MSTLQREEAKAGKESVGPALSIQRAVAAGHFLLVTQDVSQPLAYPAIHFPHASRGMLEVAKPPTQRRVETMDRDLQAHAAAAPRAEADRIPQLPLALVPRPAPALVEPVAQELEARRRRVHHTRLVRMKRQAGHSRPLLHLFQGVLGFLLRLTEDHKVV